MDHGVACKRGVLPATALPELIVIIRVFCATLQSINTLNKKNNSIACHLVRGGVARDEWRTSCVNDHDNKANLLIKVRNGFVRRALHRIYGDM